MHTLPLKATAMMAGGALWVCRSARTSSGVMLSRQSGRRARQNRQCVSSLRTSKHVAMAGVEIF